MDTFLILEIIATLSRITCVYLQTKEKIQAWPFGILSVSIASYIFFHSKLYSDLLLHVIYIILNFYGWYMWSSKSTDQENAPILNLSAQGKSMAFLAIVLLTLGLGYFMGTYTDADLFYFDAFTTSGSLVAQFLLAKKYLQNWLIWIVVDMVAIPLYLYKGLYFFAFLFLVYLVICIYGYKQWK